MSAFVNGKVKLAFPSACCFYDLVVSRREWGGEGLEDGASQRRDCSAVNQSAPDAITGLSSIGGPQLNTVNIAQQYLTQSV